MTTPHKNDRGAASDDLHVVLGAGPAGSTVVQELLARGLPVRHVNLGPVPDSPPGVETVEADLSSLEAAVAATSGAAVVYHAVNVPYHLQVEQMPRIGEAILGAASRHGARLVVLDTLYPYGEADGEAITESTPWSATSRKGQMRAELDGMYLQAHARGDARVVLGRSADFYGPRVVNSTLGGSFFPAALAGEPVTVFGDITLAHSYSYVPDVASGLVDLGTAPGGAADGRVWHLPTVPAATTEQVIELAEQLLESPLRVDVLEQAVPVGPFDETFMREYEEMFYQHRIPQNMISAAFEQAFHRRPTPLRDGLAQTFDWYRAWLAARAA